MDSKIVFKLENGENYYIIAIAYYNNEKYYVTNHLTADAKNITDDFCIFKEIIRDNKLITKRIQDDETIYEVLRSLNLVN